MCAVFATGQLIRRIMVSLTKKRCFSLEEYTINTVLRIGYYLPEQPVAVVLVFQNFQNETKTGLRFVVYCLYAVNLLFQ